MEINGLITRHFYLLFPLLGSAFSFPPPHIYVREPLLILQKLSPCDLLTRVFWGSIATFIPGEIVLGLCTVGGSQFVVDFLIQAHFIEIIYFLHWTVNSSKVEFILVHVLFFFFFLNYPGVSTVPRTKSAFRKCLTSLYYPEGDFRYMLDMKVFCKFYS